MSSHPSDVPPTIKTPPSSQLHHAKTSSTHSIAEANSFPKVLRSHHSQSRQHGHHSKDRDKAKDKDDKSTPSLNLTLQPTISVTGLETGASRSESVTPAQSQAASRRTSLLGPRPELDGIIPSLKVEGKSVKELKLMEEREKGGLRASELRNELGNLNTLSNNSIRRLDNTYYSVLEKLGVLQNTITSLKELAHMTRQLNDEFETEAGKVAKDLGALLDGFHDFKAQQQQIEELAERVKAGREVAKTLGTRVDQVRDRVEGWEKAEGEWQDRTRKRLRVLWILMSIAAAIVVAASVFHYTPVRTPGPDILTGLNVADALSSVPELEKLRNQTWSLKQNAVDALINMSSCTMDQEPLEEDPRLRLFDEL